MSVALNIFIKKRLITKSSELRAQYLNAPLYMCKFCAFSVQHSETVDKRLTSLNAFKINAFLTHAAFRNCCYNNAQIAYKSRLLRKHKGYCESRKIAMARDIETRADVTYYNPGLPSPIYVQFSSVYSLAVLA